MRLAIVTLALWAVTGCDAAGYCGGLAERHAAAVTASRACASDSDCRLVGGGNACGLGCDSAVNRTAWSSTEGPALETVYRRDCASSSCDCFIPDGGAYRTPRCFDSRCTASP